MSQELISRIKASNENDVDNGLAGWVCRACHGSKKLFATTRPSRPIKAHQPAVEPTKRTTSDSQSLPLRLPPTKQDPSVKVLKYKQSTARVTDHNKRHEYTPTPSHIPGITGNTAKMDDVSRVNATAEISHTRALPASPDPSHQALRVDLQHVHRPSLQEKSIGGSCAGSPFATNKTRRISPVTHKPSSSKGPIRTQTSGEVDVRRLSKVTTTSFGIPVII